MVAARVLTVVEVCAGLKTRSLPVRAIELKMASGVSENRFSEIDPTEIDERQHARRFADLPVTITGPSGLLLAGMIRNISRKGCFISLLHGEMLNPGLTVALRVQDHPAIVGKIVRNDGSSIGIQFLHDLEPDKVRQLSMEALLLRLADFQPVQDRIATLPSRFALR